jgi:hypothetical protein
MFVTLSLCWIALIKEAAIGIFIFITGAELHVKIKYNINYQVSY